LRAFGNTASHDGRGRCWPSCIGDHADNESSTGASFVAFQFKSTMMPIRRRFVPSRRAISALWDALRTTLGHFLECGLRELCTTVTEALVPHQQHLLPNHFHCSAIAAAAPRSVQNAITSKG
jgi:hypothetical protein